jgi:hypothetical protein
MRTVLKVVAWTAAFAAAAGIGAYVAANTDPFPPGVDRPTATATASPSPTPAPPQRWVGVMRSATRHDLFVGGSCRTRWRTELRFTVDVDGRIDGTGVARLRGDGARCDFAVAQVQTRMVRLVVSGRRLPLGALQLSFDEVVRRPDGSDDLGGFLTLLEAGAVAEEQRNAGIAEGTFTNREGDGNRGRYVAAGRIDLRCAAGCS